jgi:hypothetical protein
MKTRYFDGDTFTREGATFRFRSEQDDTRDAPWEREDGHGPVSDWTTREKEPGEVIIASDHRSYIFYNLAEATRIARREKWGVAGLVATNETPRAIAALAANEDCDRMRAFCDDEWHYLGIIVDRIDSGGAVIDTASLWGIESDSGTEYFAEVAHELADELLVGHREHEAETDAMMSGL